MECIIWKALVCETIYNEMLHIGRFPLLPYPWCPAPSNQLIIYSSSHMALIMVTKWRDWQWTCSHFLSRQLKGQETPKRQSFLWSRRSMVSAKWKPEPFVHPNIITAMASWHTLGTPRVQHPPRSLLVELLRPMPSAGNLQLQRHGHH